MSASQGNISQPSHPKCVWVSFCGRGDGCACTDMSVAGLWSAARCWGGSDPRARHPAADCNQTPPGRRSSGTAVTCFRVPRQKTSRKRKISSLVCLPEIPPCFFFTAPPAFFHSGQALLGFGHILRLPPAKWSPSVLLSLSASSLRGVWYPVPRAFLPWDAGSGWWGCAGEHRRAPGKLSSTEAELCASALPGRTGLLAAPVPPRPAPGFRCVCLGKSPALCQDLCVQPGSR